MLHGNGEDQEIFSELLPALSTSYRVVALDTRGHGQSERGKKPFDFHTFSSDLAGVMDTLNIPDGVVIGYSDGGNTALHFALKHPERTKGLIVLGSNLHPRGVSPWYQLPITAGFAVCSVLAPFSGKARANREQLGLMVRHPDLRPEQLRDITAPVLVVAGERDMIKRQHTEEIAAALPSSRLFIAPGGNHFSLLSSTEVRDEILRFLADITQ